MAWLFQFLLNHPVSLQNKTAANWLREPFKLHESTLPKKNSRICSVFQAPLQKKILLRAPLPLIHWFTK